MNRNRSCFLHRSSRKATRPGPPHLRTGLRADAGDFRDSLIACYLTKHPDRQFALDELPQDRIVQWIKDKAYPKLDELADALGKIQPDGEFRLGPKRNDVYYGQDRYDAPRWANRLREAKAAVDNVFDGGELYRIESRPNDDPEAIARIAQYEQDMDAFNLHPNLYDHEPEKPKDMECDWIVLTENGRRLVEWLRGS